MLAAACVMITMQLNPFVFTLEIRSSIFKRHNAAADTKDDRLIHKN